MEYVSSAVLRQFIIGYEPTNSVRTRKKKNHHTYKKKDNPLPRCYPSISRKKKLVSRTSAHCKTTEEITAQNIHTGLKK
jgi:hypothetical protein